VTGFDNGRLGAYDISSGDTLWEVAVAIPTGRTELDRLVDMSAGLQVVGNDVYAVGLGRAVGIALETGLVLWQQEVSSFAGLGADFNNVYVTNELSEVVALDRGAGTPRWSQDALRLRDLTAPTRFGRTIVVGDLEGYVHWMSPDDGSFLARERVSSQRIAAAPLVVGENLFTQSEDGTLAAYTIVEDAG
jgi:outer membrane protein assembly factor BamB